VAQCKRNGTLQSWGIKARTVEVPNLPQYPAVKPLGDERATFEHAAK
jgi:hypothetical protein